MRRLMILVCALLAQAALLPAVPARGAIPPPKRIDTPAAPESSEPSLAVAPDGTVWLSWLERRPTGGNLFRAARLEDSVWSEPLTIASGDSFFVNWADIPTLLPLGGGRLIAHWPWKSGVPIYSYDVRLSQSRDDGRTWSAPIVPHRDGTPTEHGFVSMAPHPDGALVVWLDGRDFEYRKEAAEDTTSAGDASPGEPGHDEHAPAPFADMSLRGVVVTPEGGLVEVVPPPSATVPGRDDKGLLDPRVCECCQTAMVRTRGGFLVAYRDRSPSEVRDISLVRYDRDSLTRLANGAEMRGAWSKPYSPRPDRWRIEGCPVNGPAMDADGDRVAITWYTEGADTPCVWLAFSKDGGRSLGKPIHIDDGKPHGRVDVVLLEDGSALVTWLEDGPEKKANIRARRVAPNGVAERAVTIAATSSARASGFPRVVRSGKRLIFAWTEVGRPTWIRTAVATLK